MGTYTLTELQYSDDRKGPFRLYIYGPDGLHSGAQWFRAVPKYPDEEITGTEAMVRALEAFGQGLEVRITDGGDMLVYHAKDGKVLYPQPIGNFWAEVCGVKTP
jgi:hypothetical protein